MFAMSTADLKIKGALVQKIDIPGPFHSMDIPESKVLQQ